MKKLLCFIGLAAFASIEAKNYWECDSQGKYRCSPQRETCCRSRSTTGWACFPMIDAVCCSDGINCCPNNTICDLSAKTCRKKQLSFLSIPEETSTEPTESPASSTSTSPVLKLNPIVPAGLFLEGFFEKFDFFVHVADGNTCLSNQDFGNFLADVLNKLQNVPLDANLPKFVEELIKDFIAHSDLLVAEAVQCKQLGASTKDVFNRLRQRVMQADYVRQLSTHLLLNFSKIKEMADKLTPLAQSGEFKLLGRVSGEIAKFVFFWDLTEAEKQAILN